MRPNNNLMFSVSHAHDALIAAAHDLKKGVFALRRRTGEM
jgi:hypothetical protein